MCFSIDYNFIIVISEQKLYLLKFFSQVIVFRYIFCNKSFKVFLEGQMSKDKPACNKKPLCLQ